MDEELKKSVSVALQMAMWDAYYIHHDHDLLEKDILQSLDLLMRKVGEKPEEDV